MDEKEPKTMTLCNKNAPKVLNSGTPGASNHFVTTLVIYAKSRKNIASNEITPDKSA